MANVGLSIVCAVGADAIISCCVPDCGPNLCRGSVLCAGRDKKGTALGGAFDIKFVVLLKNRNQVKGWSREEAKGNTRHLCIVVLNRHGREVGVSTIL